LAIRAGSEMKTFRYTTQANIRNHFFYLQVILSDTQGYNFHCITYSNDLHASPSCKHFLQLLNIFQIMLCN
jgi:hypothetical protein